MSKSKNEANIKCPACSHIQGIDIPKKVAGVFICVTVGKKKEVM